MKLTMKRKGEFVCNWVSTDNKCGVGENTDPRYSYECHIETAPILDKNGFVFDQLEIDKYFQTRYTKGLQRHPARSCESIALSAVEEIKHKIESHMLSHNGMSVIYRIAVTISFGEQALMTAEWVPEKAKPIANVKKIKILETNDERRPY